MSIRRDNFDTDDFFNPLGGTDDLVLLDTHGGEISFDNVHSSAGSISGSSASRRSRLLIPGDDSSGDMFGDYLYGSDLSSVPRSQYSDSDGIEALRMENTPDLLHGMMGRGSLSEGRTDSTGRRTGSDTGDDFSVSSRMSSYSKMGLGQEGDALAAARRKARESLAGGFAEDALEYGVNGFLGDDLCMELPLELGIGEGLDMQIPLDGGLGDLNVSLGDGLFGLSDLDPNVRPEDPKARRERLRRALDGDLYESEMDAQSVSTAPRAGLSQVLSCEERQLQRQRRRMEIRTKALSMAADASTSISTATMKTWLANADSIVAPELQGVSRSAHMMRILAEKRRSHGSLDKNSRNGDRMNHADATQVGLQMANAFLTTLDEYSMTPTMWMTISQGDDGPLAPTIEKHNENMHIGDKVEAASIRIAQFSSSRTFSSMANQRRGMVGGASGGIGDISSDGSVVMPLPPTAIDSTVLVSSSIRPLAGAFVSPAVASTLHAHRSAQWKKLGYSLNENAEAMDDDYSSVISSLQQESVPPDTHNMGEDLGKYVDPSSDAGLPNADPFDQPFDGYNDGYLSNDINLEPLDEEPIFDTPSRHSAQSQSTGKSTSVLESLLAANASGTLPITPKSVLQNLKRTPHGSENPPGSPSSVATRATVDSTFTTATSIASESTDLSSSSLVSIEKWRPVTVAMLRALAALMTAPSAAPESNEVCEVQTQSSELVPFHQGGNFANLEIGKGSYADPISFDELTDGAGKRVAAGAFYQLLLLKSWGVINVNQSDTYTDIKIARSTNFAQALRVHS